MTEYYISLAQETAKLSRARRLQVGAVIVTTDDAMLYGWNGTPAGWDNVCEDRVWMNQDAGGWLNPDEIEQTWPYTEYSDFSDEDGNPFVIGRYNLKTKPEVLHAEMNCLSKLAKSTLSGKGASLFLTHSPCMDCAKAVYQAGIEHVFYVEDYRSDDGIVFLKRCGINIQKVDISTK